MELVNPSHNQTVPNSTVILKGNNVVEKLLIYDKL